MPYEVTTFIARSSQIEAVQARLDGGTRLLTVTGAPGVGKSRFVRELVQDDRITQCWDVAYFDLCGDATPKTVEKHLNDQLSASSTASPLLVVIDNCDLALPELSQLIPKWLDETGEAYFILTSRETLGLRRDALVELDPLSTDPARRLYSEVANNACSDFEVTDELKPLIDEVINHVDGLPLAVELAAWRIATYPPAELLKRRSDWLDILAVEGQGSPPHHRSLRQAVDWSWQRLSECERHVLAQCSAFHGGFGIDAAESVVDIASSDVVDIIDSLIQKSLLHRTMLATPAGENRLQILECVRLFAAEKLHHHREEYHAVLLRHALYYADRPEVADHSDDISNKFERLHWLERERRNVLQASAFLSDTDHFQGASDLAVALGEIAELCGPVKPLQARLDALIARSQSHPSKDACHHGARLLATRGELHKRNGRLQQACDDWEKGAQWASDAGDETMAIWLLLRLAEGQRLQSQLPKAHQRIDDAMERIEAQKDTPLTRIAHAYRAACHIDDGDLEEAQQSLTKLASLPPHPNVLKEFECLRTLIYVRFHLRDEAELSLLNGELSALVNFVGTARLRAAYWRLLGDSAYCRRDTDTAIAEYKRALTIFEGLGEDYLCAVIMSSLGGICLLRGETQDAATWFAQSLHHCRTMGLQKQTGQLLLSLAALRHERGQHDVAEMRYAEKRQLDMESIGTLYHRGWAALLRGWNAIERNRPECIEFIEEGLEIFDKAESPHALKCPRMSLAIAEYQFRGPDVAMATMERARQLAPQNPTPIQQVYIDIFTFLWEGVHRPARRPNYRSSVQAYLDDLLADSTAGDADVERSVLQSSFIIRVLIAWLQRSLRRSEDEQSRAGNTETTPGLEIGFQAGWFRVPGEDEVRLTRRKALRLVLETLVEEHQENPGKSVSIETLFEVGWPGESIKYESAKTRVYWAIYTLRKLGIGDALQTGGDGYLLDPNITIEQVPISESTSTPQKH